MQFNKIIALLNLCVLAYLSYLIYGQHTPKEVQPVLTKPKPVEAVIPDVEVLLEVVSNTEADLGQRMRALKQLPPSLDKDSRAKLIQLLEVPPKSLQAFELLDSLLNYLSRTAQTAQPLADLFQAKLVGRSLSSVMRERYLKALFILGSTLSTVEAESELAAVKKKISEATEQTQLMTQSSLVAVTLEGWLFLENGFPEKWNFQNERRQTVLRILESEGSPDAVVQTAIRHAKELKLLECQQRIEKLAMPGNADAVILDALDYLTSLQPLTLSDALIEVTYSTAQLQMAKMRLDEVASIVSQ